MAKPVRVAPMSQPVYVVGIALLVIANVGAAAQTKLQCADSATSMKNVSTDAKGNVLSTTFYTCAFDKAAVAINCDISTTQPRKMLQTTKTIYATIGDFVDQFVVTPHLQLMQKFELRGPNGSTDAALTMDNTYTYDSRKRLIREDSVSAYAKTSLAWIEWDAAGRPTKGRWATSPTAPEPVKVESITYDDKAKTMRRITGGLIPSQIDTELYRNGNEMVQTMTNDNISKGYKVVATMTTLASEKICR